MTTKPYTVRWGRIGDPEHTYTVHRKTRSQANGLYLDLLTQFIGWTADKAHVLYGPGRLSPHCTRIQFEHPDGRFVEARQNEVPQ